jgi:hypothetical protein
VVDSVSEVLRISMTPNSRQYTRVGLGRFTPTIASERNARSRRRHQLVRRLTPSSESSGLTERRTTFKLWRRSFAMRLGPPNE